MGKKKKNKEQLPEGMSRRQAKLAARAAERAALERDPRPFGGFESEADLVALQVFVPAATVDAKLKSGTEVKLVTVLPGAVAALVREDGKFVALQTNTGSQNPGRDLAYQFAWVENAKPGEQLNSSANDGTQPALTDIFEGIGDITVEDNFDWWLPAGASQVDPQYRELLQRATDAIMPTQHVDADVTGSAWWVDAGAKAHIRWVRTDDEEPLLKALARVGAAGDLHLGEDTKFAGVFRTHGLVVPVFDLDPTMGAEEFKAPLEAVAKKIEAAFGDQELSPEERRYLENIKSRQVTIR
ncbi:MAG: DUF5926 family protein [Corynebacterium sp.]|nr:DUF5926 family protein [Corynebacterium sp.]